ncbi:MAG: sulfatase [Verrucomicrobia bacterium]|nr:sulfatase [Verrucomicrobiota bacterium]
MKPILLALFVSVFALPHRSFAEQPNVLFIAIDDLRDLSAFPNAKMPNLDRLAKMGMKFSRAYCAAPVCNASRASLLSGLRPFTTGIYENNADGRKVIAPELALPATFRKAGYYVCGAGKIDHEKFDQHELWDAWQKNDGKNPEPTEKVVAANFLRSPLDCEESEMQDYRIAQYGIDQLRNRKLKTPFFLAIGLHNPHSPWNVPRKYYDQYPLKNITLPSYLKGDIDDLPPAGQHMAKWAGTLLPKPDGDHAAIIGRNKWKEAIQGYLAAAAFADAQIGRILDAYEQSKHRDKTILCLWSDHGWHLGEKDHWRKFSLWEEGTRSPLYWIVPGITQPGSVCERPVDFMSLYPTLTDLCGIPTPKHVEGPSIKALLTDPKAAWETPAITTYLPNNHTIRFQGWRYIRYADGGEELYDEQADPNEWKNLANDPAFAAKKAELAQWLPKVNHDDIGIEKEPKSKKKPKVKE